MATSLPYPKTGDHVLVVQKQDYASGKLTEGTVQDILTSKKNHPRGTKVRLTNGIIGRIQKFADHPEWGQLEQNDSSPESPQAAERSTDPHYFDDPEALV